MKKLNNKFTLLIIIISLLMVIGYILYRYQQEKANIKIDEYNFNNLETTQSILGSIDNNTIQLNTLRGINNYTTKVYPDIIPMKNCYYIKTNSIYNDIQGNNTKYVIGFSLESNKYKTKYKKNYYIYPENYKFSDLEYKEFMKTISIIILRDA